LGLTFGRLRPVHVNGVIFGAFSTLFIGECYYLVPRLCGVRVPWSQWGVPLAWVIRTIVLKPQYFSKERT
jgi:cytochrome c oxidase cbb3-type subunit 1